MAIDIDHLWADRDWRECFRLANQATARGVVGYTGSTSFDAFDAYRTCATSEGASCGAPYLVVLAVPDETSARFAFISGRCDCTVGNGSDVWDDNCKVDVQIAATLTDLVRLAMTDEERGRLGFKL